MAILNLTPDSFSDGGELATPSQALARARACIEAGADMLDLGGESTRPGAAPVAAPEQISRIIPALRALRDAGLDLPITVDTTLAPVAEAALDAGADGINDVSAGTEDPRILHLAAERAAGVVLMHRVQPPQRDSYSNQYATAPIEGDVLSVVRDGLARRLEAALAAGIELESIALDPGLGFGKTVEQNLALMADAEVLGALGRPLLFGHSRKSFLRVAGAEQNPAHRDAVSACAAALMYRAGARFFRVHNVQVHRQALALARALYSS